MTEEVRKITEELIARINRNMGNDDRDYDEEDDVKNDWLRMDYNINHRLYCYDRLGFLVGEVSDDVKSMIKQTEEATEMLAEAFGFDGDHMLYNYLSDLYEYEDEYYEEYGDEAC